MTEIEIIKEALNEDIPSEDISSKVFDEAHKSEFTLISKGEGILCGIEVFKKVFEILGGVKIVSKYKDGDSLTDGKRLAKLSGKTKSILSGERTALNFLGRMSGIATLTNKMVSELKGSKISLADTRKTTPLLRSFEKYAVKIGGGKNHRMNLSDMVMLKDNHIKAAGSIKKAIEKAKRTNSFAYKIEVEVENLKMAKEAAYYGADIIMLDNMTLPEMKKATNFIRKSGKNILIELSGNVDENNIKNYKDLDIDIISSGKITHSAPCFDFSLKGI